MRKIFFSIFLISLGIGLSWSAQANGLSLVITKECEIQLSGDNCIAEFNITNSTGGILDGTAFFDVGYSGVCGELFEVGGIDAWYDNQSSKMEWDNVNRRFVSAGFEIPNGLSQSNLEIHTSSALCPGEYTFGLQINGVSREEEEKEYITPSLAIGGGGGGGGGATAAYCGDGKIDSFRYEECDDGNNIDGDGCSSTCVIEGEVKGETTEKEGEEPSFAKASEGEGEVAGATIEEEEEKSEEEGEIILPEGVAGVFKESTNCAKWWIFLILLVINALIWLIFTKKERRKIFFILGLALLIILFILWLILPCLFLWLIIVLEAIYLVLAISFGRLRSRKEEF